MPVVDSGFGSSSGGDGGTTLSSSVENLINALPLDSVTDWSSVPAPWVLMGPNGSSLLDRSNFFSLAAGGMTIKCNHSDSTHENDHAFKPTGIARRVLERDFTVSIELSTLDGSSLAGTTYYGIALALHWGRPDHLGQRCWIALWFDNSGSRWYVRKYIKLPGSTTYVNSNLTELSATATPPASPCLKLEWAQDDGFKAWARATNGDAYTEIGGGSVATGYVDPTAGTTNNVGGISGCSDASERWLCVYTSQDYNAASIADSSEVTIENFTVEASTL